MPGNLDGVTLNFQDRNSEEGKLKRILLGKEIGVVAALSTSAVTLGMGGVGKTCALKETGHEDEMKQHYGGEVYWLSLCQDATDAQMIRQIVKLVKDSGGILLSKNIGAMEDVSQAAHEAGGWFSGHRCLFLCDDLRTQSQQGQTTFTS